MEGRAAGNELIHTRERARTRRAHRAVNRQVWLPKLVYDALPWFYLSAGLLALLAGLYLNAWFWIVPHTLLFAAACLHLAWFVFRRRRDARKSIDSGPG